MPLYPAAQNFTAGSIPFGGVNSLLTQDNPNLFWDDTNNRLGIGTTTPGTPVHVVKDGAAGVVYFMEAAVTSSANPTMRARRWRGTIAAPLRVKANDGLIAVNATAGFAASDVAAATASGAVCQFRFLAAEDFTSTAQGTYFDLSTTPIGTAAASSSIIFDDDGRLSGNSLHNSAGAVTGTAKQYIASGTYTPTLTNVTNLAASTAYVAQWMRVGNVVTVSGKVDVDPTAVGATQLGMSLPIASNLVNAEDCAGTANASGVAGQCAAILADAANDRAEMNWIAADITNQAMYYTYTYEIL